MGARAPGSYSMPWQRQANTSAASSPQAQPRFLAALGPWCGDLRRLKLPLSCSTAEGDSETADPRLGTHTSGFTPQCFLFLTAQSSQAVYHTLLQGWFHFHHFGDTASVPPLQALRDILPVAGHFGHQASGNAGLREQRCPYLLAQPKRRPGH